MPVDWNGFALIASAVSSILTPIGLVVVIIQLRHEARQRRLAALEAIYSDLDTQEARLARDWIYRAPVEALRWSSLRENLPERERVEGTLAAFERLAYKILTKQVPAGDAYNLYGGVLLGISARLWLCIQDQRNIRAQNPFAHRFQYRRYLEHVIREWVPQYCRDASIPTPPKQSSTDQLLASVFPDPPEDA